eukprot:416662_1
MVESMSSDYIIYGYIHLPILIFTVLSLIPIFCLSQTLFMPKCLKKKWQKHIMNNKNLESTIQKDQMEEVQSETKPPPIQNNLSIESPKSLSRSKSVSKSKSKSHDPPSIGSKSGSKAHGQNVTATAQQILKIPIVTKLALIIYIFWSVTYLICTSSITLLQFRWPKAIVTNIFCKNLNVFGFSSYILSRSFLYIFFYLRTYDTFTGTTYKYKKCFIYTLNAYALFVGLFVCLPGDYVFGIAQTYDVQYIENYGGWCHGLKEITGLWWFMPNLAVGFLMETVAAFLSIYLLINKLFAMLNDMKDVCSTHQNKLILLVTRLVILILVAVISSYVCIMTIVLGLGYTIIFYSCDTMINMYCLWLTFSFNEKYYEKYFCGDKCTKCCFPMIKTLALTCVSKKHTNKCFICCCYLCRYCCVKKKRRLQVKIYKEAKTEIQLIVASK